MQGDTASEWTRNTPHPSRDPRIAHTPGIASPDSVRQARSCQRGHTTGVLSRVGILALQGGGDVNPSSVSRFESVRHLDPRAARGSADVSGRLCNVVSGMIATPQGYSRRVR